MSAQPLQSVDRRRRTVSNRLAADARAAAEAAGIGPEVFTARTGISAQDLIDVSGRIDGIRHERLITLLHSLSPSIEWLAERPCGLYPHFPVLGNVCFNSRTLREAMSAFARFRPLIGEFDFLFYSETPDWMQFEYVAEFVPHNCGQALANFQVLVSLIRAYDTKESTVFHVTLTGKAPRNAWLLAEYFGAAVQYGGSTNCIRFTAPTLDEPFAQHNATLAPRLLEQAEDELQRVRRGHLFSASVEQLITGIVSQPDDEMPSQSSLLTKVCERLDTSRWTLHRQLRVEGLHFSELEARVKLAQACRLLGETRRSLSEISDMLGFSSQSAFTRFFRSRRDMAPQAFRQHMLQRKPD